MKNILIIGASNHAKVIIDMIKARKDFKICGIIDELMPIGTSFYGFDILGNLNDLLDVIETYTIYGGVIAIENNNDRKTMMQNIQNISSFFTCINVISPKAILGKDVKIGQGSVIYPRVVINSSSYIGACCIIKSNTSLGHDSSLNDFSSMGFRVHVGGNVSIGMCSTIENGVKVLENVNIGDHQFIDSGKLIRKDLLK